MIVEAHLVTVQMEKDPELDEHLAVVLEADLDEVWIRHFALHRSYFL